MKIVTEVKVCTFISVEYDGQDYELRGDSWYMWMGDSIEFCAFDDEIQNAYDRYKERTRYCCYQCENRVSYIFDDGRCGGCTQLTPEEVRGH
jgi:hypothetical protein